MCSPARAATTDHQEFISHRSGSYKSKSKVPANSVPSEASLSGL